MTDYELTYLWLAILAIGGGLGAMVASAVDEAWAGRRRFPTRRGRSKSGEAPSFVRGSR